MLPGSLRTRDVRGTPFLAVCVVAAAGIGIAIFWTGHWLRGIGVVGVSMFLAAVLRFVLTDRQAGLLAIRRRTFDVVCYLLLGGAIIGAGLLIPH